MVLKSANRTLRWTVRPRSPCRRNRQPTCSVRSRSHADRNHQPDLLADDLFDLPANFGCRTEEVLVEDFQKRGVTEWVRGDRQAVRNYIASATMPLAGAKAMFNRREGHSRNR